MSFSLQRLLTKKQQTFPIGRNKFSIQLVVMSSLPATVFPPGGGGVRSPVLGCGTELFTRYRAIIYHWGRFHEEFVTLHRCLASARTFNRKGDANQHMKRVHNNRIVQWQNQNHLFIAPGTAVRPLPPRETPTAPTNTNAAAREAAAQARP